MSVSERPAHFHTTGKNACVAERDKPAESGVGIDAEFAQLGGQFLGTSSLVLRLAAIGCSLTGRLFLELPKLRE